jgi:O-antigen/teichoic acid export membrane protein
MRVAAMAAQPDRKFDEGQTPGTALSKFAAGAAVSVAGSVSGRFLRTLGQIIFARLLGPALYGLYTIGWVILQIAICICPMGLDKAVLYFLPHQRNAGESGSARLVRRSLSLSVVCGAAVGAVCWLIAPWLAVSAFRKPALVPVFRGFSVAMPLAAGMKVAAAGARGLQRVDFSLYTELIAQPFIAIAIFLVLYALGGTILAAVGSTVAAYLVALALGGYFLSLVLGDSTLLAAPRTPGAGELLAFGLPAMLVDLTMVLTSSVDRLAVGYFRPSAEVGIYQAAVQLAVVFSIIQAALAYMFSSVIADLYHGKNKAVLAELFTVSTKWGLYLCIPVFLVVLWEPREILVVLYGTRYASGAQALRILALGQFANAATGAVGYLLTLTGNQTRLLRICIASLGLSLVLSIALVPNFGIVGAAVAFCSGTALLFGWALFEVRKILGIWPYDRRYASGLIAAVVTGACLFGLQKGFSGSAATALAAQIIAAPVVFAATLWVLGFDAEDREILSLLRRRIGTTGS